MIWRQGFDLYFCMKQVNISMVVDDEDAPRCVQELHKVLWPESDRAMLKSTIEVQKQFPALKRL